MQERLFLLPDWYRVVSALETIDDEPIGERFRLVNSRGRGLPIDPVFGFEKAIAVAEELVGKTDDPHLVVRAPVGGLLSVARWVGGDGPQKRRGGR